MVLPIAWPDGALRRRLNETMATAGGMRRLRGGAGRASVILKPVGVLLVFLCDRVKFLGYSLNKGGASQPPTLGGALPEPRHG